MIYVSSERYVGLKTMRLYTDHLFYMPIIAFVVVFLFRNPVSAQGTGYTITRVETKTVSYAFPDTLTNYLKKEQVELLPWQTRDSVIISVYANNDIKTTTWHLSDSRFETWMTRPARSVSDKKSLKVYNSGGQLMLNKTHSAEYKSHYTNLKTHLTTTGLDLIPDFVQLTSGLKSSLMSNGFVMTNLGGGTYRFVKDSITLYYNNTRKYNEMLVLNTDGSVQYNVKRDYKVNSFGQTVPAFIEERFPDPRFPDACVQTVERTVYSTYQKVAGAVREEEDTILSGEITIYPNPSADQVTIQLENIHAGAMVTIVDVQGQIVYSTITVANAESILVDITSWLPGIYVCKVSDGDVQISTSFVRMN